METESSKEITPRKRVALACNRCRARKYKCDGAKPSCSTCSSAKNSIICTYETSNKKRGLPEGYVRGMEKLWGIAMRKMDKLEEHLLSVLNNNQDPLVQAWNDNSSGPLRVWRKSKLARALERHMPTLESSRHSTGKRKRYIAFSDSDGDEPYGGEQKEREGELESSIDDMLAHSDLFAGEGDDDNINSKLDKAGPQSTTEPQKQSPDPPENDYPPSCMGRLVDIYFSYTHCWFPILEKHQIRRLVYCNSRNDSLDGEKGQGNGLVVILWAIAALTTHQVSQSDIWCKSCGIHGPTTDLVRLYYMKARSLIPAEEDEANFRIVHVQALLILVLLNIGHGEWPAAWLLTGKAIQIAINLHLGTHHRHSLPSVKGDSRSLHVFWGCFVLDTLVSAKIKRMPHLRPEDIDGMDLLCEEGDEEWDTWSDCLQAYKETRDTGLPLFILSTFNRLIELCKVVNSYFISQNHYRTGVSSSSPSGWHPIENLMDWNNKQKHPLKFDANSTNASTYLHHYNLRLTYLFSLVITEESIQLDHFEKQLATNDNVKADSFLGRLNSLIVSLLMQQSEQQTLLVVPPTYTLIVENLIDRDEGAIDHTMQCTEALSDLFKIWPGIGRQEYHYPQCNGSYPTLPLSNNPRQQNLQGNDQCIPLGFIGGEPSNSESHEFTHQHEPHLGPNEGLSIGDNSSLSEIDLHSAFDELIAMDTICWTRNWRQGMANLGFADDDQTNELNHFS